MRSLFNPAILLMNRVRYPVKFGVIFIIVMAPLLFLSLNLIASLKTSIATLESQRLGLSYVSAIRQPVEQIQQHRGMTAAYLSGSKEFYQRIMQKRDIIDKKLAELKAVDNRLGAKFTSGNVINDLLLQWNNIKEKSMNVDTAAAIKMHSNMVASMLNLMNKIADSSKISMSSAVDSKHISDAIITQLPQVLENMGQARAVASSVAATGKFSNQKIYVRLAVLTNDITHQALELANGLETAINSNKSLTDKLGQQIKDNNVAIKDIHSLLNKDLLNADTISISSEQVFKTATRAISGSYKLYDKLVPMLDKLYLGRINDDNKVLLVTITLVTLVLLLIAYLFFGFYFSVRQSIAQISKATDKLSEGDLTVQVKLDSHDEMSQIAHRFNVMTEKFNALIQQIISSAGQLATASDEVSTVAKESANNVECQRHETDQVATAINEMTATVHEVANNAGNAAGAAANADNEARSGKAIVENTSKVIAVLAHEIENAARVTKGVEEDSKTIGSVLDVIKGIAEQTNLLALNAAIEAARAGEQGRGFAVVADEVRTLASRTQESTQEINSMIEQLQSSTQNAVSTMGESRILADSSVADITQTGQALNEITELVTQATSMNTHISVAADEQGRVAEEINQNIVRISQIAEETTSGSNQTAESSQKVMSLADELKLLMKQFSV